MDMEERGVWVWKGDRYGYGRVRGMGIDMEEGGV